MQFKVLTNLQCLCLQMTMCMIIFSLKFDYFSEFSLFNNIKEIYTKKITYFY